MAPRSKTLKIGKETTVVPLDQDGKSRIVGETETFVLIAEEQNSLVHQMNPELDPVCKYMLYFSVSYTAETERYLVIASVDVTREGKHIAGAFVSPTIAVSRELIKLIQNTYMQDVTLTTEGWHAFVLRMNPADLKRVVKMIYPKQYNPAKHLSDCIEPLNK